MPDLNHLVVAGRIVKNANFRYTQSGKEIADFTIATNRSKKNAAGEYESVANYFNLSTFVKSEKFKKYLVKGQQITVEGYLKQDRWEQDDGAKRTQNNIGVTRLYLVFPKKESEPNAEAAATESAQESEPAQIIFDGETPDEELFADGEGKWDVY